jgi:hypothetical protein
MEVHVVTTIIDGAVMGVYTKSTRAAARALLLERDGIECQVTATLVNTTTEDGEDNDPQD